MKYPEYKAIIVKIRGAAQHLFDGGSNKIESPQAEGHLSTLVNDLKTHQFELDKKVEDLHLANGKPIGETTHARELFDLAGVALFLLDRKSVV